MQSLLIWRKRQATFLWSFMHNQWNCWSNISDFGSLIVVKILYSFERGSGWRDYFNLLRNKRNGWLDICDFGSFLLVIYLHYLMRRRLNSRRWRCISSCPNFNAFHISNFGFSFVIENRKHLLARRRRKQRHMLLFEIRNSWGYNGNFKLFFL